MRDEGSPDFATLLILTSVTEYENECSRSYLDSERPKCMPTLENNV